MASNPNPATHIGIKPARRPTIAPQAIFWRVTRLRGGPYFGGPFFHLRAKAVRHKRKLKRRLGSATKVPKLWAARQDRDEVAPASPPRPRWR